MTSSGTYAFDMSGGDLVVNAFAKCGKRRAELDVEMLQNAMVEANLLNVEMTNKNPHQFAVETITQALSTDASYSLASRIASVALVYVTNDSDDKCRVLGQISASRYASITDKTATFSSSGPTSFWINMAQTPELWIWPLISADDTVSYTANVMAFRQMQDFEIASGVTTDLPYRFLDVFAMGLAARLALMYAPDRAAALQALYAEKFSEVSTQDKERVPLTFNLGMGAYRA